MGTSPEKKIGKGMLIISWMLVLIALTFIFGKWEDEQYNPNHSVAQDTPGEVILQQNRQNHYIASGLINGYPVVFLLDTGATDVAVPSAIAQKIGLKPGRRNQAMTANGIVQTRNTQIDSLQLGTIKLSNVRASINPGMQGPEILLGMSALKDLELIQRASTLTIRQLN